MLMVSSRVQFAKKKRVPLLSCVIGVSGVEAINSGL